MGKVINIRSSSYERLKSLASGFEHPYQVIERLLDYYEKHHVDKGEPKKETKNSEKRKPKKDRKR